MTRPGPRRFLPLFIAAILLGGWSARAQHTLHMIRESGPPENRVDLAVLGDGYTADEQQLFAADAEEALDRLFANTPYAEYLPLFNIARIDTVSAESGADHPSQDHYVDTFFGCYFDCYGLERLICCDYGAIFSAAASVYPAYDVLMLLVNDKTFGGSGGPVAISSTSSWAFDVPPHEFGHTFAGLGDEYDDPYPGFVFGDVYPNVSPTADRDELKWEYWVADSTPLPTPISAAVDSHLPVGAYEGACYQPTGLFRPAPRCLMRSLDSTLCPVCSEQMVLAFWGYVDPIDFHEPEETELAGAAGDVFELVVEPVRPEPDSTQVGWYVDGEELIVTGEERLLLPAECLEPGAHEVVALVQDATLLVLVDDEGLLTSTVAWTVTRTDQGPAVDCPDLFDGEEEPDGGDGAIDGKASDDGCGCASVGMPARGLLYALFTLLGGGIGHEWRSD